MIVQAAFVAKVVQWLDARGFGALVHREGQPVARLCSQQIKGHAE